jgi:sodium transport system permease protein
MSFRRAFVTVFKKELRELVRDKRALLFLLAPPFILPAIAICGAVFIGAQAIGWMTQGFQVAVINSDAAPALVQEIEYNESIQLVDPPEAGAGAADWGDVMVIVALPENFDEQIENDETAYITMTTRDATWATGLAASAVRASIEHYNDRLLSERLDDRGLDRQWLEPVIIGQERARTTGIAQPVGIAAGGDSDDAAEGASGVTASSSTGDNTSLGAFFLPLAVTSWLVGGGLGLIIDTTVGEKERRTMEALLLTPASRLGIVTGKLTVVFVASMAVMSVWLVEGVLLTVAGSAGPALLGQGTQLSTGDLLLESTGQALVLVFYLVLLILPFVVTLNSLMMAWCTFASSYKESNLVLFLLQLALPILVIVSIFSVPSDVSLAWLLTPIMGTIIAIRDLFSGVLMPADLILAVGGGVFWAALSLWMAAYIFSREWALVRGIS